MAIKKNNLPQISLRAGTDLTYNRIRGNVTIARTIIDIEYIKPKDDVYLAISQKTGFTALGNTPEEAYSSLVFKLYNSLRDVMDFPDAVIGQEISQELKDESLHALRMPQDRQWRALMRGIEDFLAVHRTDSVLFLKRIEYNKTPTITTADLEDTAVTPINVDILDTCDIQS